MTDPKEFHSVDELFRKTFDQLDQSPAANGWDTPSNQVWEHVQTQIKPNPGWSAGVWTTIASFAVILVVGMYLALQKGTVPSTAPATETAVAPTTQTGNTEIPATVAISETQAPVQETKTVQPKGSVKSTPKNLDKSAVPVETSPAFSEKKGSKPRTMPQAQPLPGIPEQEAPNTTEALRRALWKKQLPLLPMYRNWDPSKNKPRKM
jgi:hypothetical protein